MLCYYVVDTEGVGVGIVGVADGLAVTGIVADLDGDIDGVGVGIVTDVDGLAVTGIVADVDGLAVKDVDGVGVGTIGFVTEGVTVTLFDVLGEIVGETTGATSGPDIRDKN